jgi:hypothetical protein
MVAQSGIRYSIDPCKFILNVCARGGLCDDEHWLVQSANATGLVQASDLIAPPCDIGVACGTGSG